MLTEEALLKRLITNIIKINKNINILEDLKSIFELAAVYVLTGIVIGSNIHKKFKLNIYPHKKIINIKYFVL
jgi:hypothetical protein